MNRRSIMIASALLITAGVSTAAAQVDVVPHTSFGVLAGANFAKLSGNDADGAKTRTGFVGGISADIHIAPQLGLEIDGLYSQQGAKENIDAQDVTFHLDYVQVPVLLRYRFPTHTALRPFIVLGPSVGFRVKCELTAPSDSATCNDFFGENAKSVDVSGTVGAGLGFKLGKEELSISGRYNMGFTKVFQDSDSKNRVFSLLAGISF
jgi:opacity protein-like surface antigen